MFIYNLDSTDCPLSQGSDRNFSLQTLVQGEVFTSRQCRCLLPAELHSFIHLKQNFTSRMIFFQTKAWSQCLQAQTWTFFQSPCNLYPWTQPCGLGTDMSDLCLWLGAFLGHHSPLFISSLNTGLHVAVTELFAVHFRSNADYEAVVTISGMLEEKPRKLHLRGRGVHCRKVHWAGQCGTNVQVTGWMQECPQLSLYFHLLF